MKEALATYCEIMSSKSDVQFEIDSYDGDDPYLKGNLMNGYWSDDNDDDEEEEDDNDEDDDEDDDEGGRQYGLTAVSLEGPDLIQIVENVVQNDYCALC